MKHPVLKFLLPVIGLLTFVLTAAAKPLKFDIPAQPATTALVAFSKQSGIDVLYSFADLQATRSQPVAGEFEPDTAIAQLLRDSGFTATRDAAGKFVVARVALAPGSVSGMLIPARGGGSVAGISVIIAETGAKATVDAHGSFKLTSVPSGTYTLIASGDGFSRLRITDVVVHAGVDTILGAQEMPVVIKDGEVQLMKEVVVSAKKDVETLAAVEVLADKVRPFATANVDLPRTVDDAQPYYIFEAKAVEVSGAANIGDFLNQRLTMNTAAITNSSVTGINLSGNTSSINLRGVGVDKTLILVNGRRLAGGSANSANTTNYQVDLNGISLSAIDRVEVLPSSASGIYGGGAIGGVVNVILKKDYHGGEIRTNYDTPMDTHAARRQLSLSYGLSLEGGRTHVNGSVSWTDESQLLLQDRVGDYLQRFNNVLARVPTFIYAGTAPRLGSLPNLQAQTAGTVLTLKPAYGGASLNSTIAFVPAGTSPTTSAATLGAGLLANAGRWNLDLPPTTESPNGLLRQIGTSAKTTMIRASVNRQMRPWLEAYADFTYAANQAGGIYNQASDSVVVTAASPINPFNQSVTMVLPSASDTPAQSLSLNRTIAAGALIKLPAEWTGVLDYSFALNYSSYSYYSNRNFNSFPADLLSGAFNPFVDSLRYPLDFVKYQNHQTYAGRSEQQNFTAKANGPLPALPWGTPKLTVGLERRLGHMPNRYAYATTTDASLTDQIATFLHRNSTVDAGYLETKVPLIKPDWLPAVHALEFQGSGRVERFSGDTGTSQIIYQPNPPPARTTLVGATLNGAPYFSRQSYSSKNYTVGVKYQPIKDVIVRASKSTAFLPPTSDQLVKNPVPSTTTTNVVDPKTGLTTAVYTLSGGNPDLTPQNSRSTNVGVIWQPAWKPLEGFRFDAEYYRIEQFGAISTLAAQAIVNAESSYPGRVTRDASGAITLVDISSLNLYKRDTEGWDLSADYTRKTGIGEFNLHLVESILLHLKNQYSIIGQEYEAAGYSYAEQGATKFKSNGTLSWDWRRWSAGWTVRYISSYKQNGAAGGPGATQRAATGTTDAARAPLTTYTAPQGGDSVSSQIFNDCYFGYAFEDRMGREGSWLRKTGRMLTAGLSLRVGIRNIFNKAPAFDAYNPLYNSPYGDARKRSIWLNVRKAF